MIVVSDTSSISNLLQIGLVEVLFELFGEITITPSVKRELYVVPDHESQMKKLGWIKVKSPQNQKMVAQLLAKLDLGESESITLAIEENAQYLIIDEQKGRYIANSYGVKVIGILGVLIKAKQEGLIKSVKPSIDKLTQVGFWLDKKLIEKVLKQLGE